MNADNGYTGSSCFEIHLKLSEIADLGNVWLPKYSTQSKTYTSVAENRISKECVCLKPGISKTRYMSTLVPFIHSHNSVDLDMQASFKRSSYVPAPQPMIAYVHTDRSSNPSTSTLVVLSVTGVAIYGGACYYFGWDFLGVSRRRAEGLMKDLNTSAPTYPCLGS